MQLQLESLFEEYQFLQQKFGAKNLAPIYGAGKIQRPHLMLVFMNPTSKNIASDYQWQGIRAPWLGTKNVWKLFFQLELISPHHFKRTQALKDIEWSEDFAFELYTEIARNDLYVTNFAKCTQMDARPLKNTVFQKYKDLLEKEIELIAPQKIVTFGNQVSENLLSKHVSVSNYQGTEYEQIIIDKKGYKVFPSYYPVGQGQRNMPLAKKRLSYILGS